MLEQILHIDNVADLHAIIDVIPSPVIVKNRNHRIVLLNQAACELFGHPREVLVRFSDFDLFPEEEAKVFHDADDRVLHSGRVHEVEEQVTSGGGCTRTVITRKQRITLGGEHFIVAVLTDVTAYREAEARNRYLAFHDVLTGLPNRALLNERIDQILLRQSRNPAACALIYVDLDRFKEVNDTFGHQAGDELVRQFAERLGAIVRACDTAARLGGDEFAVLLQGTNDTFEAIAVCERILAAASLPFTLDEGQAHVGASVGLVEWTTDQVSRVELHQRADMALYQAKREGRGCLRVFTEALNAVARQRRLLEAELRRALASGQELEVEYQPLFATRSEHLVAFEALVRWNHPRLGMLQPDDFLGVAEESGLIVPLGEWVLERACEALAGWPQVDLAVNLSPTQLASGDLLKQIRSVLERTGFAAERLQLEVTEHTLLDMRVAVAKLRQLRAAGIKIVLDDFGTGYSSLSHLQRLDIDKVKIDRSFVQDLANLQESRAIVRAVARLGRSLGVAVTAEGVETEEQRAFLRTLGCEEMQGYFFSRPLQEKDALALLEHLEDEEKAA